MVRGVWCGVDSTFITSGLSTDPSISASNSVILARIKAMSVSGASRRD